MGANNSKNQYDGPAHQQNLYMRDPQDPSKFYVAYPPPPPGGRPVGYRLQSDSALGSMGRSKTTKKNKLDPEKEREKLQRAWSIGAIPRGYVPADPNEPIPDYGAFDRAGEPLKYSWTTGNLPYGYPAVDPNDDPRVQQAYGMRYVPAGGAAPQPKRSSLRPPGREQDRRPPLVPLDDPPDPNPLYPDLPRRHSFNPDDNPYLKTPNPARARDRDRHRERERDRDREREQEAREREQERDRRGPDGQRYSQSNSKNGWSHLPAEQRPYYDGTLGYGGHDMPDDIRYMTRDEPSYGYGSYGPYAAPGYAHMRGGSGSNGTATSPLDYGSYGRSGYPGYPPDPRAAALDPRAAPPLNYNTYTGYQNPYLSARDQPHRAPPGWVPPNQKYQTQDDQSGFKPKKKTRARSGSEPINNYDAGPSRIVPDPRSGGILRGEREDGREHGGMFSRFGLERLRGNKSKDANGRSNHNRDNSNEDKNLWDPNQPPIYFYDSDQPFFAFTNFSPHQVVYEKRAYPTSEHLFQAFKFMKTEPKIAEKIRGIENPRDAFTEAKKDQEWVRKDWEKVRIKKMDEVVYLKFSQHEDLLQELLSTYPKQLIENSPTDAFWGIGQMKNGRNELGKALMRCRDRLMKATAAE